MKNKFFTKRKLIYIAIIVILIPVVLVAGLIGYILIDARQYCTNKDKQTSEIRSKFEQASSLFSVDSVGVNGDCLTGAGTSFALGVNKSYPSALAAKDEIVKNLTSMGIDSPIEKEEPKYISDIKSSESAQGTLINELKVTYYPANQNTYEFIFKLDRPVLCTPNPQNRTYCGSESQKDFLKKALVDQPVSSIYLNGTVRFKDL